MRSRQRPLRRLAGRTVIVAAVVGVTMLGNLRLQASEIGHPLATRAPGIGVLSGVLANRTAAAAVAETGLGVGGPTAGEAWRVDARPVPPGGSAVASVDAADIADDGDAADAAQVVPAIYAWDKDVRFVYLRHVSKWM